MLRYAHKSLQDFQSIAIMLRYAHKSHDKLLIYNKKVEGRKIRYWHEDFQSIAIRLRYVHNKKAEG